MLQESRVQAMKNFGKSRMFRTAVIGLCSAGLGLSAAVAQQETAPPPPPDQQQQGPPPNGQMQGQHRMDPERRVEMLQRRLDLNDSQTAQVRQIFTESHAQMETLRSNASLAPEDRQAQMMTLRQGEQARIRAVLTPAQQAKFDAMQAKMRERHADGGGESAPPPPPPAGSPQA
jgi:Spy/CpxP family protein refolding chaperone